jgi:Kef-type K+ transport system membrane component KefB
VTVPGVELFLPLAIILVAAKLAGLAARRLGLPVVFGELVAGVLIGPSVLGWVHPTETVSAVAEVGAVVLMFIAGLETDLTQLRRVGRTAFAAAVGGVILPFLGGTGLARLFGLPPLQSLFVGALLTATSVSISAETLRELDQLRTPEGSAILGAAVIDDVLGVLVLSLVVAFGQGGAGLSAFLPLVNMSIFLPVAVLVGHVALPPLARRLAQLESRETSLALVLGLALASAWAAQVWGSVAGITGAYLAGLLLSRTDLREWAIEGSAILGYGLLVPIFLVSVGLHARFDALIAAPIFALLMIGVAIVAKLGGCMLGAWLTGFSKKSATRVGLGMISRGEVALVIASLGLSSGIISSQLFAGAVAMTVVTTLLTPVVLRLAYRRGTPAASTPPAAPGRVACAMEGVAPGAAKYSVQ